MPPHTIKTALADTLEDLSKEDFDKFCHRLLDRRDEPRVKRNRVEDKTRLQIVDVLVSTFTESGALQVTLEILGQIGCSEEAQALGKFTKCVRLCTTVLLYSISCHGEQHKLLLYGCL